VTSAVENAAPFLAQASGGSRPSAIYFLSRRWPLPSRPSGAIMKLA
jgi:hypothetical protein